MEALLTDVFVKIESGERSFIWDRTDLSNDVYVAVFNTLVSLDKLVLLWNDETGGWMRWEQNTDFGDFSAFHVANPPKSLKQ
jgi:hypothetical protein